ncbi:MAG: class I SAM-dependent methyltransferase [Pseudomonadota bacterium]
MVNATIFGSKAKAYKDARPGYPGALFDWVAEQTKTRDAVWDCATGSGQAAVALSERFDRVFATDISADQISAAVARPNIQYSVAPAEASGLADHSVDAITVATALHWFDFERYWDEVRRVLRPGGVFAAWSYDHFTFEDPIEEAFMRTLRPMLAPFWSDGNRIAMEGYKDADVHCPLQRLSVPRFEIKESWPLGRVLDFAESWSATMLLRQDPVLSQRLDALLSTVKAQLEPRMYHVRAPIHVLAGRD